MLQFFVLCVTYTLFQALDGVNGMDCSLGLKRDAMICPYIKETLFHLLDIDKDLRKYCCINLSLEIYCCDGTQFAVTVAATAFVLIGIFVTITCIIRFLSRL